MNAQEAINYIHSFFWKGSIPGLGRTQELLRRLQVLLLQVLPRERYLP